MLLQRDCYVVTYEHGITQDVKMRSLHIAPQSLLQEKPGRSDEKLFLYFSLMQLCTGFGENMKSLAVMQVFGVFL